MLIALFCLLLVVVLLASRRQQPANIICVRDELDDHSQDLAYPHDFAALMGRIRTERDV